MHMSSLPGRRAWARNAALACGKVEILSQVKGTERIFWNAVGAKRAASFVDNQSVDLPTHFSSPLCRATALEVYDYEMSCRIRDIMEGSFLLVTIIREEEEEEEEEKRGGVGLLLSGDRQRAGGRLPLTRSEPARSPPSLTCADRYS